MATFTRVLVLPLILSTLACEAEPTQSEADARIGWRSTQQALGDAGVTTASGTATVDPDGVSAMATGTTDCEGGGSMHVVADADVEDDRVQARLQIDFDACTVDDVTIDGSLDYEALVEEHHVVAEYHGDLEWSGAVSGSCAVDASADVSTEGSSASVHVSGSVCGHDWASLGG